jgi:hypothetical protein
MIIAAHTKVGKTAALTQLPNSILIDLEDGSEFVEGVKINLVKVAHEKGVHLLDALRDVAAQLKSDEYNFDYVILDTTSAMENLAKELGLIMYKGSPMGKSFKGTDVTTLANGGGYLWLRLGFEKIYELFNNTYNKCLILSAHVKVASINKNGKDLMGQDISLTGKLKAIVSSDVDAIGFMFRAKSGTENILSFKTSEQDLATGARPPHLRGQEFIISKLDTETNELETYWDKYLFNTINT